MKTLPVTKADEMAAVRALAVQLGPHSYLGPWLAQRHAELAALIRSDHFPEMSLADAAREAAALRSEARRDADSIMEAARTQAGQILAEAEEQAAHKITLATRQAERIKREVYEPASIAARALQSLLSSPA